MENGQYRTVGLPDSTTNTSIVLRDYTAIWWTVGTIGAKTLQYQGVGYNNGSPIRTIVHWSEFSAPAAV